MTRKPSHSQKFSNIQTKKWEDFCMLKLRTLESDGLNAELIFLLISEESLVEQFKQRGRFTCYVSKLSVVKCRTLQIFQKFMHSPKVILLAETS